MAWIIHQALFHQNVEIENLSNFNTIKNALSMMVRRALSLYTYSLELYN